MNLHDLQAAGVMSSGPDQPLTTEDYARLAEVNSDFEIDLDERLDEMTPQQACALFDLARVGAQSNAEFEGELDELRRLLERRDQEARWLVEEHNALRAGVEQIASWAHEHGQRTTTNGTKQRGYVECALDVYEQTQVLLKPPPGRRMGMSQAAALDSLRQLVLELARNTFPMARAPLDETIEKLEALDVSGREEPAR